MKQRAETILPYNEEEKKGTQVRHMFDTIAPVYDFMNRAMTMGIDIRWRKKAIKMLKPYAPQQILDVATGTGDLALMLHKMLQPQQIVGVDLSEGMLVVAREKATKAGLAEQLTFQQEDCLNLSYSEGSFDAVTVAFGVRNFESIAQGIGEMYRVLHTGGVLLVIELSTPQHFPTKQLYNFYSGCIIPCIGRLFSKDKQAYSYLPRSIAAVPQGEEMLAIFRQAGFTQTKCRTLTFGSCSIYLGVK